MEEKTYKKVVQSHKDQFADFDGPKEHNKKLNNLKLNGISWRLRARKAYAAWFFGLLIFQNVIVFSLVFIAFWQDKIMDMQIILSALITGTLIETYFVIRIIIQWLFQNINYKDHQV